MGICMSQEEPVERIILNVPIVQKLPEKKSPPSPTREKEKPNSPRPFSYETLDIPPPEKLGLVCMPNVSGLQSDRLAIFDFDETSPTFMQMLSTILLGKGDEPGRINWTRAASSASDLKKVIRSHMVVPCMNSSRIYVVSVEGKIMKLAKTIKAHDLLRKDVSCPYSVKTLPIKGAPIHISTLGDMDGNAKGDYILIDRHTFNLREKSKREKSFSGFGGDLAFQTRHNVMFTTEWGHPSLFKQGLTTSDLENVTENFGNCLHIWKISPPELLQTIELDEYDGCFTTTVKLLHNPDLNHAFACSAIGSAVYHLFMDSLDGHWVAEKVAKIPAVHVKNWESDEIPALFTDIVISFDDRWLFVAGYLHGKIWRFDISDPFRVSLHSVINLGGLLTCGGEIIPTTPLDGKMGFELSSPQMIKGSLFRGGPALLQLSLDGKRLYVSNSIYKAWDAQFYPELISEGGQIVRVDVTTTGMHLNSGFLIDSTSMDDGLFLPRDIHFFSGDCTADNFL